MKIVIMFLISMHIHATTLKHLDFDETGNPGQISNMPFFWLSCNNPVQNSTCPASNNNKQYSPQAIYEFNDSSNQREATAIAPFDGTGRISWTSEVHYPTTNGDRFIRNLSTSWSQNPFIRFYAPYSYAYKDRAELNLEDGLKWGTQYEYSFKLKLPPESTSYPFPPNDVWTIIMQIKSLSQPDLVPFLSLNLKKKVNGDMYLQLIQRQYINLGPDNGQMYTRCADNSTFACKPTQDNTCPNLDYNILAEYKIAYNDNFPDYQFMDVSVAFELGDQGSAELCVHKGANNEYCKEVTNIKLRHLSNTSHVNYDLAVDQNNTRNLNATDDFNQGSWIKVGIYRGHNDNTPNSSNNLVTNYFVDMDDLILLGNGTNSNLNYVCPQNN